MFVTGLFLDIKPQQLRCVFFIDVIVFMSQSLLKYPYPGASLKSGSAKFAYPPPHLKMKPLFLAKDLNIGIAKHHIFGLGVEIAVYVARDCIKVT